MKKIAVLLMVSMLIVNLAGCGAKVESSTPQKSDAGESTSASKEGTDIRVGVILKTLSSEYWGYVAAGVKAAEKDLGVTVDLQGPSSETAYDEQNSMIETMLSSPNLGAIVISPLQPDSVVSVLAETNVPVMFLDTDAPYQKKVSYIGTGNYGAAFLGGEYAAKKAGAGAKAVIIGGVLGNTTSDEREKGYRDAFAEYGVNVEAVQYAEGLADKASSIMENLLTSLDNDIDIVMCHNDETAAGVSRAIAQSGMTDIIVVGFDGIQSGVQSVIDEAFAATVAQSPYQMGYMAVEKAVAIARGEQIEEFIDTGATVITVENAAEYLAELKAVLEK